MSGEGNMIRSLQRRVAQLEAEATTGLSPEARRKREEWCKKIQGMTTTELVERAHAHARATGRLRGKSDEELFELLAQASQ